MPVYAKFMKDLIIEKRIVSYEPVDNIHHYSVVVTRSLVEKKADPSTFIIGSFNFTRALCDLEASINLMPFVVFKQLVLGAPKPTTMRLVIADRTVKKLVGILYNVLPDKLRVVSVIDVDDEEIDLFQDVDAVTLCDDGFDTIVPT
ncbi:uncharacterized protein LOC107846567 [Capsicum annuum]|uniref:uncharacterized protein LOC107846567 n=1 Tax=Capsicum annuum TaxID=4072 RepID=UPI0007BFC4F0|nr:uncharacterized protein LOC107846567 [Capsicum annuum]